jgi:tellurium resistance protein TerZ
MSVNLQKGQKISLEKEAGGALSRVTMGLGWDVAKSKGFFGFGGGQGQPVDLDASVVMFDESNRPVDVVWFRQLKSKDGSIIHTGDNRTGAGDGDDEQIVVDLRSVPPT